jgi:hypothetical protein
MVRKFLSKVGFTSNQCGRRLKGEELAVVGVCGSQVKEEVTDVTKDE